MRTIHLGVDFDSQQNVNFPVDAFTTHIHMPGATGKGKSTAIVTMLQQLLLDWRNPACHVVVDFLGGLAYDLVMWMSTKYCTSQVRKRLVYARPSDGHVLTTLNPLLYEDQDQGYFKVNRATELVLRAWSAQNLSEQPRLSRWLYNAFWACAQLKLTVADTEHLLLPGSPWHLPLLNALPDRLRHEWDEVLMAKGGEATRILDSTRNRMKPFHDSGILRRMFGSTINRLDSLRFMREAKVLILDLSPRGRLSPPEANAIAGLVINEFLAAARSQPRTERYPTYLWLDEFQRMVTPDIGYAIPEVRQLGIRLILAHQSFSQLKTKDTDLTSLIFQPQTRLAFGEQGEDAELLANEFASLEFNAKWIKEELHTLRQIQDGHDRVVLNSQSRAQSNLDGWSETSGYSHSDNRGEVRRDDFDLVARNSSQSQGRNQGKGRSGGWSQSASESASEHLIARMKTFHELSKRTYYTFEEQRQLWAQRVRKLRTGQCVLHVANSDKVRVVNVKMSKPGVLAWDPIQIAKRLPGVMQAYDDIIAANYENEWFASPEEIDKEIDERMRSILQPRIEVQSPPVDSPFAS